MPTQNREASGLDPEVLHSLYAGVYILVNTETAIERNVKPVTTMLGHGYVDRLMRRLMDYETERGARWAALVLLANGLFLLLMSILSVIILM